jgi:hypothetical protein
VIEAADLVGAKRADLDRLAAYLGVRAEAEEDDVKLALRIADALRVIRGEA